MRLYLAGGAVRDLLLGRPIHDVDLVVEGDAIDFAERLAPVIGASLRIHGRFATATLTSPDGSHLDVAAARRESYAHPGALPDVSVRAKIEEDLARRDFTINAMALEIAPGRRLVDPFEGREDLGRGEIRMLHPASAFDDPTRAYRAVRYANRLGFRIAPATREWIGAALRSGSFDAVSGDRMRRELERILSEGGRGGAVRRLQRLGLDAAIDPALAHTLGAAARVGKAETLAGGLPGTTWLCYLLTWMAQARTAAARRVANRLALAGRNRERLGAFPRTLRRLSRGLARLAPSEVSRRALGLSQDELVAASVSLGATDRRALCDGAAASQNVRLRIRGSDLVSAGVSAGPAIGKALARALAARQDGAISAEQELDFALACARKARSGGS